jgi:sugar phosphate isomerase/epimerase
MVEFQGDYYHPMDRAYEVGIASGVGRAQNKIEEPIVTIGELGQTVTEKDPAGKFKNMVQGVQAAMRAGSKNIQIVMSTPHNSPMGGRPKAYGEEVRQAMKDAFLANDARLIGIEMPTSSMNNLSGFDQQQGVFSEVAREKSMDEVKDAIRFASDVGQGGGIDIVSFEYNRPVSDIATKKQGFAPEREETLQIVDSKTGQISGFRKSEVRIHLPFDPKTGKEIDKIEKGLPVLKLWVWDDFERLAKRKEIETGKKIDPGKEFMMKRLDGQILTAKGWARNYAGRLETARDQIKELREQGVSEDDPNLVEKQMAFQSSKDMALGQQQQAEELEERKKRMMPVAEYAQKKSERSYAELGIAAMNETNNNKKIRHPLHVGPEIGWPHAYGGHPDEFIELIQKSRKEMVRLLTTPKILDPYETDPAKQEMIRNPNFRKGMSAREAKKEANEHIKGMFDTGHLGMWLEHFRPELPYRERVEKFNEWFMQKVDEISKADVIGGIQAVDSAGAAHGHLPAGQGIFPVVDAVKKLKRDGFKGYIVSEGHEEEQFGEGRILLKTWQAFNAPIESKYGPGVPARQFNDIHQGYFGKQRAPVQMFGSYTPPFGEYKPWSEIPFE